MNVDTYDTTPLHEEVLHLGNRVFEEKDSNSQWPRWFEVKPNGFICGTSWSDVLRLLNRSLSSLDEVKAYGPLTNVTSEYPRP
jgi:hypothetical protein